MNEKLGATVNTLWHLLVKGSVQYGDLSPAQWTMLASIADKVNNILHGEADERYMRAIMNKDQPK